jgi:hypothetical protein
MLVEFMIVFQIVALLLLFWAFTRGGVITWAIAIVLFAILAMSFYNVEETKVLVTGINDTTINTNVSHTDMSYTLYTKTSKDMPLAYLNMGLGGLCLVFMFMEIFKQD